MALALPIVRTRRAPGASQPLQWRETGDMPAAAVVGVVAVLGALLAIGAIMRAAQAAQGMDSALIVAAMALLFPCAFALVAAIAEFTRVHTVSIDNGTVHRQFCELGRCFRLAEPLVNYAGLNILDRTRRLYIRNQDHPITGRRGPVTEFVIVLRHRDNRAMDVELFRAQPSLATLLTMHSMQHAASGAASAANAAACKALATTYRDTLIGLARRLHKPALLGNGGAGDDVLDEWPADRLDEWLQAPAPDATRSG